MDLHSHTPLSSAGIARVAAAPPAVADDAPSMVLPGRYLAVKRAADIVIALVLLAPAIPVILSCALLILLTSRGPAFYTQTRLGRFGKPFLIWKLRTMEHNCELNSGARWAMRNDPRATPVGRLLRITHLDELPQLWNVLRGDMSLVGPRPERPEFIPALEQAIPDYRKRLLVRPGVTGVAQLYLPPDTGVSSVRKKVVYDLHYIQSMGLWLDIRLMIATGLQAIAVPCRLVQRCLRLPRPEQIERPAPIELPTASSEPSQSDPHGDHSYETGT